jgi:nitrate/TMAO reductase-like tetraheme cytochrome c subunit
VVKINAGNNFKYRDTSELGTLRARTLMQGLAACGIEVIGIGPIELNLAKPLFQEFCRRSPIDLVCANLPGVLPYVRLRKDGGRLRVLVTSVIDPQLLAGKKVTARVKLGEPVAALKRVLGGIDHDLAIVVIHATKERLAEIVRQSPGIDLVINGLTRGHSDTLGKQKVENPQSPPIVYNNKRGQYVYYIDLDVRTDGRMVYRPPVGIKVVVKKIDPDPAVEKILAAYHLQRERLIKELKLKKRMEKLAQLKKRAAKINDMYLGSQGCRQCHSAAWEKWRESTHARAIESLRKRQRENDDECLRCHVTGMENPKAVGGFSSLKSTPWMAGVQCEACHGPGANHAQKPEARKMISGKQVDCRACHNPDNDPDFEYEQRWRKIRH